MSERPIAVLGAGPAGLACAFRLCKYGKRVALLERQDHIGGMSATLSRGNLKYDLGPHAFYYLSNEVRDILDGCLSKSVLVHKRRNASFFLRGKHISYPLNPFGLLGSFSARDIFLISSGYLGAKAKRLYCNRRPPETLQELGFSIFGRRLYSMTLEKIYRKTWGVSTSDLSPSLGGHPSSKINFSRLVLAAAGIADSERAALHRDFLYHPDGIGQPFFEIGSAIEKMGGQIILKAHVKGLEIEAGKAKAVFFKREDKLETLEVEGVISTIPLIELYRAIQGQGPQPAGQFQENGLRYRNLIIAYVVLDGLSVQNRQVTYLLDEKIASRRSFEQKRFSENMVPQDKSLVGLEYFCDGNDSLWNSSQETIEKVALCDLQQLTGGLRHICPSDFFIHKMERAYPTYGLDYAKGFLAIFGYVNERTSNLISTGRQGLFLMTNIDGSMRWGLRAATHLVEKGSNAGWADVVQKSFSNSGTNIC